MSKKKNIDNTLIMGKNCIRELLLFSSHRLLTVFTSLKDDPLVEELLQEGVAIQNCHKQQLSNMVNSDSHQGFVAKVKPRAGGDLEHFLKKDRGIILMLDSINDPQNFGALLRAAECFGVDAVIFSKNRGVSITPVVAKASVGASELVPIIKVSNLSTTLHKLQKSGYEGIVADVGEGCESLDAFTFPEKSVLILGSEGKGVQKLLCNQADFKVYIPMKGRIDSLNVSQAAAVLLSRAALS